MTNRYGADTHVAYKSCHDGAVPQNARIRAGILRASIAVMRLLWLLVALVFAALLAVLQKWAVADFLYWHYPWFDTPMHFLGGLTSGAFLVGVLHVRRPKLYLLGCILIAVGWEVFEVLAGLPREANYAFDTTLDLLMDALGMTCVYFIARRSLWRLP